MITMYESTCLSVKNIKRDVVYNKLFLYELDLLLRSFERTDIKVAKSGLAVLQWDSSTKSSVAAIKNYQY